MKKSSLPKYLFKYLFKYLIAVVVGFTLSISVGYAQGTTGSISGDQDAGIVSGDISGTPPAEGSQDFDGFYGPQGQCDCRQFNNNPWQCDRTPGCQFSRIYSECIPSTYGPGPGPGPIQPIPPPGRQCSQFNYRYSDCVNAGCRFDGDSGMCFGGGQNPYPHPQPRRCEQFNYDERSCRNAGCQYDYQSGYCQNGGGYQPQPRRWTCSAQARYSNDPYPRQYQGQGRSQNEASQQAITACGRYEYDCYVTDCRQM